MLTVTLLVCALIALARANDNNTPVDHVKVGPSCPDNWIEIQGRCFHYVATQMSWVDAERNCLSMKANLASIHSAEEYRHIQAMITGITQQNPRTWIGGSDCQQDSVWLWTDGSQFLFAFWALEQPDNYHGNEACVEINYGENNKWNDAPCSTLRPSVCVSTL